MTDYSTDYFLTDYFLTDCFLTDYFLTDCFLTDYFLTDYFLTDYFLTDYFLTDYFLTDYFLIELYRWNTTNSPNFTCTAGVGCMGTLLLRKPHNTRVGKAKRQHARRTCVTFHCIVKQRHMSGIEPDASHNEGYYTTN
jgi:hypothetical protein